MPLAYVIVDISTDAPVCTHRVRVFTPHTQLPFVGHPTMGTAAVLADIVHCCLEQFAAAGEVGSVTDARR